MPNPLLDKIKEQYSDVYKSCEKACEILKKITNVDKIPESEVAYVAIHIAAALEENIVDKVMIYIAPKIIGGESSKTPVGGRGIDKLKDAFKLKNIAINILDEDILVEGYID